MNKEKTVVEFELDDSIISISRLDHCEWRSNRNNKYYFSYRTRSNNVNTIKSYHRTIGSAMKRFKQAVKAIKNGTCIKSTF